ncbi:MAG: transposase [Deltaproteobacteria bacterium]|jgi:transposase|nr:transposase [Deltaproteobacteria bacterium]
MTTVVKCKSGKYTYLYESTSYRNEDGNPRCHRKCVGRIDPVTGKEIYNPEYLERVWGTAKQPDIIHNVKKFFLMEDIEFSSRKVFGVNYLLNNIANSIGLTDTLKSSIPDLYEQILTIANFMVSTGEPMMYCNYWLKRNDGINIEGLSSQMISKILLSITDEDKMLFYKKWANTRLEHELLALDITSVSSYSELIDAVAWGYNRDKEKLPQVNICLLVGEKSRLPVFQMVYNGALKDVSTLKTSLAVLSGLKLSNISIIMDKGFASKNNIDAMLNDKDKIRFLLALPFTMKFTKDIVESVRSSIDSPDNTIVIGNDILRAVAKNMLWDDKHKIKAHIFYNAVSAYTKRDELYGHISMLKEMILSGQYVDRYTKDIEKYLQIKNSSRNQYGINIKIRDDIIDKELANTGWMVAISNFIKNPKTALKIYRSKDVVEKAFDRMKNCIDLGRLRIQSDTAIQNKIFISFISLILIARIHKVMLDQDLYKKWTMKELFKILETNEVTYIQGQKILHPLTSKHKEIFSAFGFQLPE